MAVKKDRTYGRLVRQKKKLERMADLKHRRMAEIMAGAMDDKAAWLLADLPDGDVRRVAALMFERVDGCVAQVKAEKDARRKARQANSKDRADAVQP